MAMQSLLNICKNRLILIYTKAEYLNYIVSKIMKEENTLQDILKEVKNINSKIGNLDTKIGTVETTLSKKIGTIETNLNTKINDVSETVEFIKNNAVTKSELKAEMSLQKNKTLEHIDEFAQKQKRFDMELAAFTAKTDRHETSINHIAKHVDLKLP